MDSTVHAVTRVGFTLLVATSQAACSRDFEGSALHATWKPPNGIELIREVPGPHPRAEFSRGVILQAIDDLPPSLEDPNALGQEARKLAGLSEPDSIDCKAGTLPAGPVVRCEVSRGGDREMAYVVLVKGRMLLVDVAAPPASYGQLSAKVEGSLSTLRVH